MWTDHNVIRGTRGGVYYPVEPCPAPRQVRSDVWKPRPMVQRYRAFRDQIRLLNPRIENGAEIIFYIKMPESWSEKKKKKMSGEYHQQKPDLDNLVKALLDAVFGDDSHIAELTAIKVWARQGGIEIVNG